MIPRCQKEFSELDLLNLLIEKPDTQENLMKRSGLSRSSVFRRIKKLETLGYVKIKEYRPGWHGGRIPIYKSHWPKESP